MAVLDFKEIPQANKASGEQDAFELFARDALDTMGLAVLQGPARGADLGKDLIVEESRSGLLEDTKIRWLVSCKHFAHSGKSVGSSDEVNIFERVRAASCDGFLGFYSTLPSSGLSELLHRQSAIAIKFLDHEEIERRLLASVEGRRLVARYFPDSSKRLKPTPAEIFDNGLPLECEYCGKNLLDPPSGIWVLWRSKLNEEGWHRVVDFHFACKGECDRIVEARVRKRHESLGFVYDGWDDIPDLMIPTVFIRKVMAVINGLVRGDQYEPEALDKLKTLLLAAFPFVARHLSDEDQEKIRHLQRIPSYFGGLG
jgi:hypothetical protein